MLVHRILPLTLLTFLLILTGCDEETRNALSQLKNSAEQMQSSASEMGTALEGMNAENGEPVDPVDFRELRALLPEQVVGLERSEHEGSRQQMGGFALVQAQAEYDGSDREHIEIEIIDIGNAPGLSVLGLGMMGMEIDRESSSGFERTGTYNGHRMHEEYDSNQNRGKRTVLVEGRFVVGVSGRNVPFSRIEEATDAIDLGALQGMASASSQ